MSKSKQQTLEQERAAKAWSHIERLARDSFKLVEDDFQPMQKLGMRKVVVDGLRLLLKQSVKTESEFLEKVAETLNVELDIPERDELLRVAAKPHPSAGKYGGWVKKFPSLVMTNGLGQTLAFLRAKGKGERHEPSFILYGHVSDWVMHQLKAGGGSLLEWLLKQNSSIYRQATTEALAFSNWLKRFAESELKIDEETE